MAFKPNMNFQRAMPVPAADLADARGAVGIPPGKKMSIKNMINARPGGGRANAYKKRPKPGVETQI
jgi:hypothetical protein